MRLAYLCNRYPAISMTFVRREIEGLQALGIEIATMSIRAPLPGHLLSDVDRDAARSTYAVLPPRWRELLPAHVKALTTRPGRYLRTLRFSLALSSGGPRASLWRLFYFLEAIAVWDRCRKNDVRHIHAHFANVATDVAMLSAYFADRRGEPWSWSFTLHGPVEFYDVYRSQLGEKLTRASFVICISEFARSQAMAFSSDEQWSKFHVVHCGVDPEEWSRPSTEPDTPVEPLRVLSVGRLIALKGHAVLIEAVAEVREQGGDLAVTIVGDGPCRAALEALAEERGVSDIVHFAGAVGPDHIRDYFTATDAFCLSSFAEGVPVVLMEAMATELAVVSTPIMGIPELIEDEVSGLLVAPGRADRLAQALCRLADDPILRGRLGRAGREKVIAEFTSATSSARLASVLRDYGVLSGPTAASPEEACSGAVEPSALLLQNAGPPSGSAGTGR